MASFDALPSDILDLIAVNFTLRHYLRFCDINHRTRFLFSHTTLIPVLKNIETLEDGDLKKPYEDVRSEECHFI